MTPQPILGLALPLPIYFLPGYRILIGQGFKVQLVMMKLKLVIYLHFTVTRQRALLMRIILAYMEVSPITQTGNKWYRRVTTNLNLFLIHGLIEVLLITMGPPEGIIFLSMVVGESGVDMMLTGILQPHSFVNHS